MQTATSPKTLNMNEWAGTITKGFSSQASNPSAVRRKSASWSQSRAWTNICTCTTRGCESDVVSKFRWHMRKLKKIASLLTKDESSSAGVLVRVVARRTLEVEDRKRGRRKRTQRPNEHVIVDVVRRRIQKRIAQIDNQVVRDDACQSATNDDRKDKSFFEKCFNNKQASRAPKQCTVPSDATHRPKLSPNSLQHARHVVVLNVLRIWRWRFAA